MINLHTKFYKLKADPFRLSSDYRFSFGHKSYTNAISYLKFGFYSEEGFIVITGRPGSGKTTLINQIISELDTKTVEVGNLVTTRYESHDLLNMIAASFDLDVKTDSKSRVLLALEGFLKHKHEEGKRVLLIVDEAQGLTLDSLEELRQLSNFHVDGTPLLQIFLIGQEEFHDLIESPRMEQLRQRIVVSSHLEPLTESETLEYVTHRLKYAGWTGNPAITRNAILVVHHFSGGVPRIINLICGRLLLYGCTQQKYELNIQDIKSVIEELSEELLVIDNDIPLTEILEKHESSDQEYLSAGVEGEGAVNDIQFTEEAGNGGAVQARTEHSKSTDERHLVDNTAPIINTKKAKKVDNHDLEQIDELSLAVSEKKLEEEIIVPVEPSEKGVSGDSETQDAHKDAPTIINGISIYTMVAILAGLIMILALVSLFFNRLDKPELMATGNQPEVTKLPVDNKDERVGLPPLSTDKKQMLVNQDLDNRPNTISGVQSPKVDIVKSDQPSKDFHIVKPSTKVIPSVQNNESKELQQPPVETAAIPEEKTKAVKDVNQNSDISVPEESLQDNEQASTEPDKAHELNQRIDKLFMQADQQFKNKQLMTPKDDNAWQTYHEILSLDPGNEQARVGIGNIAQTYVIWARDQAKKENIQHAEYLFNKALEVSPGHKGALSGLAELEKYKQQKQSE